MLVITRRSFRPSDQIFSVIHRSSQSSVVIVHQRFQVFRAAKRLVFQRISIIIQQKDVGILKRLRKARSCVSPFGFIWVYMDLYGFIWVHMVLYRFIWIYMGLYGFIWVYMGLYDVYEILIIFVGESTCSRIRALALESKRLKDRCCAPPLPSPPRLLPEAIGFEGAKGEAQKSPRTLAVGFLLKKTTMVYDTYTVHMFFFIQQTFHYGGPTLYHCLVGEIQIVLSLLEVNPSNLSLQSTINRPPYPRKKCGDVLN